VEVDCLVRAAALFVEGPYFISGTEQRLLRLVSFLIFLRLSKLTLV